MKAAVLDEKPSILTGEKAVYADTIEGRLVDLEVGRGATFLLNASIFSIKYKAISSVERHYGGYSEI